MFQSNDIFIANIKESNLLFNIDRATEIDVNIIKTNITNSGDHLFSADGNVSLTMTGSIADNSSFSGNEMNFISDRTVTIDIEDYIKNEFK